MELPKKFVDRMTNYLEDDAESFLASFDGSAHSAMRINTNKVSKEAIEQLLELNLEPVAWSQDGYYYDGEARPGRSPLHEAGAYYLQEPSAMVVASVADVAPTDMVLDLCAAPGGKSTALAVKLQAPGLLVSNDIHPKRARILLQNVERMGLSNTVVTNESPDQLAGLFPGFFDKIIVDAPCSGEGMFNKEEGAVSHWSLDNIQHCHLRQMDILRSADIMLKPGGHLIYSTCTYAPEENEGTLDQFLKEYSDYELLALERIEGFDSGHPDWIQAGQAQLQHAYRLWPHRIKGEGHFAAKLQKKEEGEVKSRRMSSSAIKLNKSQQSLLDEFIKDTMTRDFQGPFVLFGDDLYRLPSDINLANLKVLRPGLNLGTFKKNRFEPSHHLALSLSPNEVKQSLDLALDGPEIEDYLLGRELSASLPNAWTLVTVEGLSIGWGKMVKGRLKNHYPKGLRRQ